MTQELLWRLAGVVMLLLLPTFLIASAAVDLKVRWARYAFSILAWPLCMSVGLYYFTITAPSPEANGAATMSLVTKGVGISLIPALFWTWHFRNIVPNGRSKLK
ncbi:hypothetical protein E2F46_10540 [Luteimonas aestuarii]|uniref:Uncharacterized protein n=1 Tax=Luteimonas aestuarii TaxID=453837 RepID=A0A4R5TTC0_9GAMM|nr:hypothetical protein [Luteimonas aestuarii]TDK23355.1 hypothetical protein E2F46_10540 [Luteimonas aestuarii]